MKIPTVPAAGAAIAAAAMTLAAITALPAVAHAEDTDQRFASPSGNIRCVIYGHDQPSQTALCQIKDKTYSVPPGSVLDLKGEPCPSGTDGGNDFRLAQGQSGVVTCSYAALAGGMGTWPTLEYGQSRSVGAITCESQQSGVTCTDTSTGHFFRISRESYEVG